MKRFLTAALLLLAFGALAQTVDVDITATTNRNAFIRPLFWTGQTSMDSTGVYWLNPAATAWSDTFDSGIALPSYAAADSSVRLTWTAGEGQDHYRLEYTVDRGYGTTSWALVDSTIHADSTGFTWSGAPRGELNFRLYGANAAEDTLSSVAVVDSLEYNQSVRVYAEFHAIDDTLAGFSEIVASDVESEVLVVYE